MRKIFLIILLFLNFGFYFAFSNSNSEEDILLEGNYKFEGFFADSSGEIESPSYTVSSRGGFRKTSCPVGMFPLKNSDEVRTKKSSFNCIKMDDSHRVISRQEYNLNYSNNSGVTSCGPGARVNLQKSKSNKMVCTREISDLNGKYIKASNDRDLYLYNYHEILKHKSKKSFVVFAEDENNHLDSTFHEGEDGYLFMKGKFSKVSNDFQNGNFRTYTYKYRKGNNFFSRNYENLDINVYADDSVASSSSVGSLAGVAIANGEKNTIGFRPLDRFGNPILPVKKSDGTSIRSLTFDVGYLNKLYLDQYAESGSGIKGSDFYQGSNNFTFNNLSITDGGNINNVIYDADNTNGLYNLDFKSYTPTYKSGATDGRQYANGEFKLLRPTVRLSDNPRFSFYLSSDREVDLQFKPRFFTEITGDIIRDNFVVGAQQNSTLVLKENLQSGSTRNSSFPSSGGKILLEYGNLDESISDKKLKHKEDKNFSLNYKFSHNDSRYNNIDWTKIQSGYNLRLKNGSFPNGGGNISTIIEQKGSVTKQENKTYFATYIYDLGSSAIYPSFVLGLDRYFGSTNSEENTFQRSLKVIGNVHSFYYNETVKNTDKNNINVLGDLDKAELQKHIRKSVFDSIKSLKFNNTSKTDISINLAGFDSGTYGIKIGDTIYFSNLNGKNIKISGSYSGVKNIVILGGNAYITGNISATNRKTDLLSIITISDKGNGGNIFIHPRVTNIDSVLYADNSVLGSTDGVNILSPKNGGTYTLLKNQLHIYGSVFSNNTIGGSTKVPAVCPYYVTSCNVDESQKYDLYNFRRGYENLYKPGTKPYIDANLKDGYKGKDLKYSMIIEYNPRIQTAKVPFFQIKN